MRLRVALLGVLALALPVAAFVPKADRIANATTLTNDAAARGQALQLDLTLRVADREPIGSGKLLTHPSGLARLELRDANGDTERHLLLGNEHSASRNGRRLDQPRAFLPPLFFLQVDSLDTFEQALSGFGLDLEAASLAPCGEALCYVLGDASRVAPPLVVATEIEDDEPGDVGELEEAASVELEPVAVPEEETGDPVPDQAEMPPAGPEPTIWVDSKTFEIVRIESRGGVTVDFGSATTFGEIRFPESITIHEPGSEAVRFDVLGVLPVSVPAAEFSHVWLFTTPAPGDSLPAGQL